MDGWQRKWRTYWIIIGSFIVLSTFVWIVANTWSNPFSDNTFPIQIKQTQRMNKIVSIEKKIIILLSNVNDLRSSESLSKRRKRERVKKLVIWISAACSHWIFCWHLWNAIFLSIKSKCIFKYVCFYANKWRWTKINWMYLSRK